MARFTRIEVATKMAETGLVPVFFHTDSDTCKQVISACYRGGVKVFEFTNRGDFAHETFKETYNMDCSKISRYDSWIGFYFRCPYSCTLYSTRIKFHCFPSIN